jgi:MFS family permease
VRVPAPGPPPAGGDGAPSTAARRARGAVAVLFLTNGALFANLVPRFPDIKDGLALSNTAFGTAVGAYGLGALIVGLLGGVLVSRWGSVRVAPLSTVGMAANLVLVALAPSWAALAAALFVAGALDAIADLAGNAHGLRVERRYRRSILNSLHGLWSIGAVIGGSMGAAAAGMDLSLAWHLSGVAVLFAGVAGLASRFLLPGRDDVELTAGRPGGVHGLRQTRRRVAGSLLVLGIIAAAAQLMEDATATWGAVYLRDDLGAAAAVGGLAFIALQSLQTVGRLIGDRLVTRYGDRAVARAGATVAGVAMTAALAVPEQVTTIVAFGAVGLGIATLIPASLRTADDIPGLPRGAAMTAVGTVDRVAIMAAPPLIGLVADAYSLRVGLTIIPVAAAVALLLTPALPASPVRAPVAT